MMDKVKIAQELVKLAKGVLSYGGKSVNVGELPVPIQRALKRIGFRRRDIEVIATGKWHGASAFEGNRAVAYFVDLATGVITDSQVGSWGGPNMFVNKPIDRMENQTVPAGSAVIAGESGGRGTFLHLYVRPGDLDELLGEDDVQLTPDEKKALYAIGLKSHARRDEFYRHGLGEYGADNHLVQSLEKKGLVQITRTGIRVTTKGINVRKMR